MPTHAALAVTLLTDAAVFFRNMAKSNESIRKQMSENAAVFEEMAKTMTGQPEGASGDVSYAILTSDLLKNTAAFFRSVAEQNEPIKEQMLHSADIYEQMAKLVAENPLGVME